MFSNKPTLYKYTHTHTRRSIDRENRHREKYNNKRKQQKKTKQNKRNKTKETTQEETKNKTIMQIFVKVSKLIHDSFIIIITKLYIIAITN